MKRICAWCSRDMGEKPDPTNPPDAVTHGICEICLKRVMVGEYVVDAIHETASSVIR